MKKILWCGVAYVALAVVQLICVLIFLFAQTAPMGKAMVQAVLLLLSVAPLIWGDALLRRYRERLNEEMLGMAYLVQNQVSLTLSAGVVNLLVSLVQAVWPGMPGLIPALAAIYLVAAWAAAAVRFYLALRPSAGREDAPAEKPARRTKSAASSQDNLPEGQ